MLTLDQKRAIFTSFPELIETRLSNDRINFEYSASKKRGKVLARELSLSGNGYVCGKHMKGYKLDPRGWVRIKDYTEEELRTIIKNAIVSMSHP